MREHQLIRREKPLGGRAIKYSQSLTAVVPVSEPGLALVAVLLLRGPQTAGELKGRSERLHEFADPVATGSSTAGPGVAEVTRARFESDLETRVAQLEAIVAELSARLDGLATGSPQ